MIIFCHVDWKAEKGMLCHSDHFLYLKQLCALSVTVRDVKDHAKTLWRSKIILQSETRLIDG